MGKDSIFIDGDFDDDSYESRVRRAKKNPPKEEDPCQKCGKTLREQMNGCNIIICYRQFLKR